MEIGGVRFLGTTLWTDYCLFRDRSQAFQMEYAERCLNDHYQIQFGRKRFSAQHALELHETAKAWLMAELAKPFAGKTVVVTHHGPHPLSVHPRFASNHLSGAFVSDLSALMPDVDLWLHGHTHDGFDYQVGRCRVVANPAGYILNRKYAERQDYRFENESFDKNMLVELPP